MNYQIVESVEALEKICQQASQVEAIMLDTEFVRTRTYYPQLGLIQLYDGENLSLIDPLAIEDMSALQALLKNQSVLKVLHACSEDLEVFKQSFSCLPTPMVDTQLMAAFVGHGLSTGFATLVNQYLDIELDKSESRADWLARPLSTKQLDYAAADVFYLEPIYKLLKQKVEEIGWWQASLQESQLVADKRLVEPDPDLVYRDIKGAWQLRPNQLAILKPLAKWRLKEAIQRDLALNFVFKEQDLWAVARYELTSLKAMESRKFDYRSVRRHGEALVAMVKAAQKTPENEWPAKVERLMDTPSYKQLFKLLKDEVTKVAEISNLATEFLASKKQLNQLIYWVWKQQRDPKKLPDLMQGWRRDLLGEKLDSLIS